MDVVDGFRVDWPTGWIVNRPMPMETRDKPEDQTGWKLAAKGVTIKCWWKPFLYEEGFVTRWTMDITEYSSEHHPSSNYMPLLGCWELL